MLKVGLVGAGAIATTFHLPAWKRVSGVHLDAVCDVDPEAARRAATEFQTKCYTRYEDMLSGEPLDIVDICTPHALHAQHACQALERGLHVVVEKPFATDPSEAAAVIALAKATHRKVMCAQHQRFRPVTLVARELIANGELGQIYYARAQAIKCRGVPTPSSYTTRSLSGGGPMMDLGSHVIDLAWWLMGCPAPTQVLGSVMTRLARQYDVEDFACAQIHFANGSVMSVETSYLLNGHKDTVQIELFGDKGGLLWPDLLLTRDEDGECRRTAVEVSGDTPASVAELAHFVECVVEDKPTLVPLEESKVVVDILAAIYASGRRKDVVRFGVCS